MSEDTRQRLLEAAKKLFAEHDFGGTTVRDIATAAGANIGAVSYHFGGKEALYRACLEDVGARNLAIARHILEPPQSADGFAAQLQLYAKRFLDHLSDDPDGHRINRREFERHSSLFAELLSNVHRSAFDSLVRFFAAAQEKGFVQKTLPAPELANLTHGMLLHQARIDAVREQWSGESLREPHVRKRLATLTTTLILDGCRA